MGKHTAQDNQPPADMRPLPASRLPDEPDGSPTVILSSVPEPAQERSSISVRIAVLVGILATVMLSGLVWAVNRRSDPNITALPIDPPSMAGISTGAINLNDSPGSVPSVGPSGSIAATIIPGTGPSASARTSVVSSQPDRPGTAAPPPPVPPKTPTHPPTTSAPTTAAAARLTASFRQITYWPGGYQGSYTITNRGGTTVHGWTVVVTFSRSASIAVWDAKPSTGSGGKVTFANESYNETVAPGASVTFAFNVTGSPAPTPTNCTVNGAQC